MCACVRVCRHLVVQVQQVPNRELNLSLHPSSSQEEDWQVGSLLPPPVSVCVCPRDCKTGCGKSIWSLLVACLILSDGVCKLDVGAVGCFSPHFCLSVSDLNPLPLSLSFS